jgi:hypothetical protein
MANASELTVRLATLEERVNNHIWFFRAAVVVLGAWLGYITNVVLEVRNSTRQISANVELRQGIDELAILPQNAFENSLSKLSSFIAKARRENVKVSPQVVGDLQQKMLATDAQTPGFWPAAAELISYRSEATANNFTTSANLSNCTDSDPIPMRVAEVGPGGSIRKLTSAYYENCRFTLDSAQDDLRINGLLLTTVVNIEFRHCLIVYRGGAFALITYKDAKTIPLEGGTGHGATIGYNGPTLQFTQCLFDFSVSREIPKDGQETIRVLLAQSQSPFVLPVSSSPTSS